MVKLLKLKEPIIKVTYDLVLVIVDRLTKYAYFIPYKEVLLASELAYIFLRFIITNYRMLDLIVLDRDTKFTLYF